jgi:hypothetical protein
MRTVVGGTFRVQPVPLWKCMRVAIIVIQLDSRWEIGFCIRENHPHQAKPCKTKGFGPIKTAHDHVQTRNDT